MIKMRLETEEEPLNGGLSKKFITCPQCLKEDWFYSDPGPNCTSCGFPWGDMFSLIHNIEMRKYFYINCETKNFLYRWG